MSQTHLTNEKIPLIETRCICSDILYHKILICAETCGEMPVCLQ